MIAVLAIFGPTASGKSAVAERIGERIPARVVAADSAQLYRGLPVLTNQSPAALVGVWELDHEASVAALRKSGDRAAREPIDMNALVDRVVDRHEPLARALDVRINHVLPAKNVVFAADQALIEQAVTNVVANAVLYNNPGGRVDIELKGYERDNRFSLRVTDTGPGVSDDEFAGLTANRRFRGDEGRSRRPGGRGVGLAIAREVTDRFGLRLDLRRPSSGGFEVEMG